MSFGVTGAYEMRVVPSLGDWITSYRVHRRFVSRLGAEHIATWRALAHLAAVVRQHQPKAVLEFGAGIGTITYLLLSANPNLNVVSVEANPFCLAQLEQNIPDQFKRRLTVVTLNDARLNDGFDLIVIDGDYGSNNYAFLRQRTICFVEGTRAYQSAMLMQIARSKNLILDLQKQSFWLFRVRWRKTQLRIPWRKTRLVRWRTTRVRFPVLKPVKTCKIGILSSPAAAISLPHDRRREDRDHVASLPACST
jgi:methyltransferase family protein